MGKPIIVGHTSPDWDCIGAIWLLMRYGGMDGAEVRFVNTGAPDQTLLATADAVVDTGRAYEPSRRRFDHHHFPGADAGECCATSLVHDYLHGDKPHYLDDLVMLIWAGDTGRRTHGAEHSRIVGIHALLSAHKAQKAGDLAVLAWGMATLDDLAEHLQARHEARAMLESCTVYRSPDGLLVALQEAPQHASTAAFEAGARLVVFQHSDPTIPTNAIGIWRAGERQEPHCGGLVSSLLNDYNCGLDDISPAIYDELCTWYRHEAGFFAGRGTAKAPDARPIAIELADVARAIDTAWHR